MRPIQYGHGGCSNIGWGTDSRLAANDAASNNAQVQPSGYQAGYGLTSDGPTTDLYHELKGSLQRPERPQVADAVPQGTSAGTNGQQGAPTGPNGKQVADSSPGATQQPAAPPREDPTATVYGMSSDGPTTDVYTALFGSRNH